LVKDVFLNNPNLLNQTVKLGGKTFNMIYKIIPQGQSVIDNKEICSIGQEFISGLNFVEIMNIVPQANEKTISHYPKNQRLIILHKQEYEQQKDNELIKKYLKEITNRNLTIYSHNVKPFIHKDNIINPVTDLAHNIYSIYSDIFDKFIA